MTAARLLFPSQTTRSTIRDDCYQAARSKHNFVVAFLTKRLALVGPFAAAAQILA